MQTNSALAIFLVGCLLASQAEAGLVQYVGSDAANSTDPRPNADAAAAAFSSAASALGPTSLITFESAPLGSFHNYAIAPGVVINGTDGVTSADQTIVNAPYSTPDGIFGYNTTTGGNQFVQVLGGNLVFTFSPAIQSFGAYIDGIQTSAETITFSDGSAQSIAIPQPSLSNGGVAFVGFTDAGKQISTVTLNALGDIVGVDDVRYGVSVAVPEPSTFVLAGSGALAMLLAARKRAKGQMPARA